MPAAWSSPVRFVECDQQARWGDTVSVDVRLDALGRTSLTTLVCSIRVGERPCCEVRTVYVATADGVPTPWPDDVRARLSAD